MKNTETIIALSTPKLNAALGIIRVSGPDTFNIVEKVFSKKINYKEDNKFYYGYIKDKKRVIDEVILLAFLNPKSYTGEDMVEINCHGSLYIIEEITKVFVKHGARQAKPGEFTFRAYINNKISLLKAESIHNLVFSSNKITHEIAISNLLGNSLNQIKDLRKEILDIIAHIEVNIDYPEYDAPEITSIEVKKPLKKILKTLQKILNNSYISRKINSGINVCIIGEPNVGKSSLLNEILKEEKAIISKTKGTTRDIVEGSFILDGVNINIYDTAGIRETKDKIESEGIKRSFSKIKNSDIIINLRNDELNNNISEIIHNAISDKHRIIVYSKSDLLKNKDEKKTYISVKNKDINGLISELRKIIKNNYSLNNFPILDSNRQITLIEIIINEIHKSIELIDQGLGIEILSLSLNNVYYKFNEIIGENLDDNILDNLFKNYCLGK